MFKISLSKLLYFTLVLILCCGFTNRVLSGYVPKENNIVIGESKSNIFDLHGDPAFKDGRNWYYVQIEIKGFMKNKYTSEVLGLTFDDHDKVSDVKLMRNNERNLYKIDPYQDFDDGEDSLGVFIRSLKISKPYM